MDVVLINLKISKRIHQTRLRANISKNFSKKGDTDKVSKTVSVTKLKCSSFHPR